MLGMSTNWGNTVEGQETKHLAAFKEGHLKPEEQVELSLVGWIGEMMGKGDKKQHNGVFILTNRRACFYRKGVFGEVLETIPIGKITSVETRSMMGHRVLNLHTSHDELKFKTFADKLRFDSVYARLEALRGDDTAPASPPPPVVMTNPIEQLKQLGELKEAGIVTQAEFETKKAELLRRM